MSIPNHGNHLSGRGIHDALNPRHHELLPNIQEKPTQLRITQSKQPKLLLQVQTHNRFPHKAGALRVHVNRPNQTETITHLLNCRRVCNRPRFLIFNPYKAVNLPFHHSSHPGTARSQQVSEIDKLDDERQQLRIEQSKSLDQLNDTKTKLQKVREELQNLRKTRDGLNETVRALKQTRDRLRDTSREKLATLRELLKKMSDRPHASIAEKELDAMEWQVQTSPLEKDDEKRLMTKIRSLEIRVTGYHKVLKLREDITKQREEADQIHAKIQELAAESQKHHSDIVQLSEAFQTLRLRREEQQKTLDDLKRRTAETNQKLLQLRNTLTDDERREQRQKGEELMEALKDTAQKKLSKGGKLTLQELSALYEGPEE